MRVLKCVENTMFYSTTLQHPRLATLKIFQRYTHDYTGLNLNICFESRSFSCPKLYIVSVLHLQSYNTSIGIWTIK